MKNRSQEFFDFDELSQFAGVEPSKFIEIREALIGEFLNVKSRPKELLELQNQIDAGEYTAEFGLPASYNYMALVHGRIEQLKVLLKQLEIQLYDRGFIG